MVTKLIGEIANVSLSLRNKGGKDTSVYLWVAFSRNGSLTNTPYAGWWIGARSAGFPGYPVPAGGTWNRVEPISTYPQWGTLDWNYLGDYDLELKVAMADPVGAYNAWNQGRLGYFVEALPIVAYQKQVSALTIVAPEGWTPPEPDLSGP